ncbi:hypothetical protein FOZ63_015207, partial [Perkinsus olseni]
MIARGPCLMRSWISWPNGALGSCRPARTTRRFGSPCSTYWTPCCPQSPGNSSPDGSPLSPQCHHHRPLTERECHVLVPALLERMGHKMAAFRGHIKNLVTTHLVNSEALVSAKAMVPMLINCIQTSKNKKSVADCLELLIGVLTQHQGTVTTGRAVKDVGRVLMSLYNDKDAAVREFAQ